MLNGIESRLWSSTIILEHFESFDILSKHYKGYVSVNCLYVVVIIGFCSKGTSEFRQPFVNK
jgi:hypothetical protein